MTLHLVVEAPEDGVELELAAKDRQLEVKLHDVASCDLTRVQELPDGALLYRASHGPAAELVEQHLFTPGLRSAYLGALGPLMTLVDAPAHLQRQGIPTPRALPVTSTSPKTLAHYAKALGGFPVALSLYGPATGPGVLPCPDLRTLRALAAHFEHGSRRPLLTQALAEGRWWRCYVVDDTVPLAGWVQFRGDASLSRENHGEESFEAAPEAVADTAVRALRAMELRCGSVDVLEVPESEANSTAFVLDYAFPPEFAEAEERAEVDYAGALLDALIS